METNDVMNLWLKIVGISTIAAYLPAKRWLDTGFVVIGIVLYALGHIENLEMQKKSGDDSNE